MKSLPFLLLLSAVMFIACQKDAKEPQPEPPVVNPTGKIKLEFLNRVDSLPLIFNKYYLNPAGDSFRVTKFNYYISNVKLTNKNGGVVVVPESYYLVQHSLPTTSVVTIGSIPPGSYTSISFLIGIDSLRNCSGAQTGDLDVAKGMFWSWNSGYIFMKLEGTAPSSTESGHSFVYHIGGFTGENKTQRSVSLSFGNQSADVSETLQPVVSLKVNVNEIFKTPTLVLFSDNSFEMSPGPGARVLADNYADMISFDKIHN